MRSFTLTLLTPSRDQRALLAQCLANVRRAAPAVEHLVVDGASTDGTIELLRAHAARHPGRFAFLSEPDRGMYDALNKGLARARGEVLGYLNCDDLLLPWAIDAVLARFAATDAPDLVYGDALEWEPATGRAALVVHPPTWLLGRTLRAGGHLAQPAVFVRRALVESLGGFDPSYRLLGDHDLWLRALTAGARIARVDEVLAIQRVVEGQLMQRQAHRVDVERARCFERAGLRVPGPAARRGANLVFAAAHRAGLLRLAGAARPRRGPRVHWPALLASGLVPPPSPRRLLDALARSTRGRSLLRLDLQVLDELAGCSLDEARGRP